MAQTALESLVRDLQKSIVTLVNKVSDLESRISEQTIVISNQSKLIAEISGHNVDSVPKDTHKSITKTPVIVAALQRPKRLANLNATIAIASSSAALKRGRGANVQIATDDEARTTPCDEIQTPINGKSTQCVAMKSANTTNDGKYINENNVPQNGKINSDDDDNSNSNTWKIAMSKKLRRRQRQIITGTGRLDDELMTVDRIKYIQAWSFKPDTSEDNVRKYLNKSVKSDDYAVEKRKLKTNRHASFVIGIPEKVFEQVTQPAAWPPGVKFANWFHATPR